MQSGHQAFIIYPLVEESEKSELLAATQEHARLQKEVFRKLKLGLLHGRMKPDEKDAVMLAFRDRKYDILVSTTVVEVGVDVPNATVMLVEGANHFGLAQLHQLRGTGWARRRPLLLPAHPRPRRRRRKRPPGSDGREQRWLRPGGTRPAAAWPGQFLGTRQAGYADLLKMASLGDTALIEKARVQAQALFARDPDLKAPENSLLAEALGRFWGNGKGDVS